MNQNGSKISKTTSGRYRNWCFTLNNPQTSTTEQLESFKSNKYIKYAIFQEELSASNTKHYQGYLQLSQPKSLKWLKKLIPRAHWELRRGTHEQAEAYCSKDETRISGPYRTSEFVPERRGYRSDLEGSARELLSHRNLARLASEHPASFVRYHKGFQHLLSTTQGNRTDNVSVLLFIGPTGTGKTFSAYDRYPSLYRKPADTRWFDGYDGQEVLLLDDFAGKLSQMRLTYTLQLLDNYPIQVEVKCGHVNLLATKIIITTNIHPRDWYSWDSRENQYAALMRRFHKVYFFSKQGTPPIRCDLDLFKDNALISTELEYCCVEDRTLDLHLSEDGNGSDAMDDSNIHSTQTTDGNSILTKKGEKRIIPETPPDQRPLKKRRTVGTLGERLGKIRPFKWQSDYNGKGKEKIIDLTQDDSFDDYPTYESDNDSMELFQ